MEYSTEKDGLFRRIRRELERVPNIDPPQSLVAAVTRLCRSDGNLGVVYVEQGVEDGETGTQFRVSWLTDSVFGLVVGRSDDPGWNGGQVDESEHVIAGSVRRLADLREVLFADPPVISRKAFGGWEVKSRIRFRFSDGSGPDIPMFPIGVGGTDQRQSLDAFIDRALEAIDGKHIVDE